MPAKTRSPRKSKVASIQARLRAHVEAAQHCQLWARKSLEHEFAGRTAQALAAKKKARRYMARMMELEGKS
jgi:hypothetical protein